MYTTSGCYGVVVYTSTQDSACPTCRNGLAVDGAQQCSACTEAKVPMPLQGPAAPPPLETVVSLRPLIRVIERILVQAKRLHPDLPRIVATVSPGDIGRGEALGWHSSRRWKLGDEWLGEILVGAEGLERGAEEILNTVLHEAAHALASARDIKDTSRGGEYHNARFGKLAAEVGLVPPAQPSRIGFSACVLADETKGVYASALESLAGVLTMHRIGSPRKGRGGGTGAGDDAEAKPKRVKVACGCEPPRAFYIAPGVLEIGDITCGACAQIFWQA